MNRAAVSAALQARLGTAAGFATKGGRWRTIEQFQETELPAWLLVKVADEPISAGNKTGVDSTLWRSLYEVHVYAVVPDEVDAHTVLDPLIDGLIATMDPGPALEEQTLGGVALRCRVHEAVQYDGGLLGAKTWAAVPIAVLAN